MNMLWEGHDTSMLWEGQDLHTFYAPQSVFYSLSP